MMNRIELKEKILDEQWKKVTLQLWEKITDELIEKVSCELEAKVSRELRAITASELNAKMIGELWEKATCELWEKVSRELVEKVSRELGKQVTDELKAKITDELKAKVSRELGKQVSRKLKKKASRELAEKASRELWEKASRELGKKTSRELGKKISRELGKKIIEEPKKKIINEPEEKTSDKPGARKSKTGNDYRSLNKRIDDFLDHLEEEGSSLQWLPLEKLSEQQIVELAITFLNRSEKNGSRFLYNSIKHSEITSNYSELIIVDLKQQKSTKLMYQIDPMLEPISKNTLNIRDTVKDVHKLFRYKYETLEDYKNLLFKLREINRGIYKKYTKFYFCLRCMGLGLINMRHLEDYIFVVERMVLDSFLFTVVLNKGIEDKKYAFEKINETIKQLIMSQKYNQERREKIQQYLEETTGKKEEADLSNIMQFFVCFLNRKPWYKKQEEVMAMLQKENEELINSKNIITLKETNDSKKIILNNGKKLSESNRKSNDVSELIKKAKELHNDLIYYNIDWTNVIIREAFVSKQKYKRMTAMEIIRKINEYGINSLGDKDDDVLKYLMFLDVKFIRGIFWESNILSEYKSYCDICTAIRELILSSYEILDNKDAFNRIYDIGTELLSTFISIIQET